MKRDLLSIALAGAAIVATVAAFLLTSGCATYPTSAPVTVDSFRVIYADREFIRKIASIGGHTGDVRGLWIPSSRTIYCEPEDYYTLGREISHASGDLRERLR